MRGKSYICIVKILNENITLRIPGSEMTWEVLSNLHKSEAFCFIR
jgi:hypothetical protein